MHYYQHNVADYRKDTAHLTLLEHGIYRQLLDSYYLLESPLSANKEHLMRTHCIRSAEEVHALENVLDDFFELGANGYVHSRCESEISKMHTRSDKAKSAANARWSTNKSKRSAKAMQTHAPSNANAMQPNTQYPIPKDKNVHLADAPDDFEKFWQDWPNKKAKKPAISAWQKLTASQKKLATEKLNLFIDQLPEFQKKDFALLPASYLNQHRWNDVDENSKSSSLDYMRGMK